MVLPINIIDPGLALSFGVRVALAADCEAGEVSCAACGSTVSALDATDGLCWDCYCIRTYGTCVSCGAVRNYDYSGGLCWDCYVNQSE